MELPMKPTHRAFSAFALPTCGLLTAGMSPRSYVTQSGLGFKPSLLFSIPIASISMLPIENRRLIFLDSVKGTNRGVQWQRPWVSITLCLLKLGYTRYSSTSWKVDGDILDFGTELAGLPGMVISFPKCSTLKKDM